MWLVDVAVPGDRRVEAKERERKKEKYQKLAKDRETEDLDECDTSCDWSTWGSGKSNKGYRVVEHGKEGGRQNIVSALFSAGKWILPDTSIL